MAALVGELVISGSRKSDGTANASGTVNCYIPGTTTEVNVYDSDAADTIITQPITLDSGGRISRSDYPDGLWVTQPIRLLVKDSAGATVSDSVYYPATANNVAVDNDGFTGTTLDGVLDDAHTSFGGQDWKYKESSTATERTVHDKFQETGIWVEDFGAVGDGVTNDTTAIQNAMNRAKVLSCPLRFGPGAFSVNLALTLTSATGVSIVGSGNSATSIVTASTTANVFTLTTCTGFTVADLKLTAAATNSGSAIAMSGCTDVRLSSVMVNDDGGGTFLIPLSAASTCTDITVDDCKLSAKSGDATARAIKLTDADRVLITGGRLRGNTGAVIEFAGTTSNVTVASALFISSTNIGILWASGMTGTYFTVYGCPSLRAGLGIIATPFDMSALSTDPFLSQWGNDVDGYTVNVTSGGEVTPDRSRGNDIRIRGTTTGSAYVIHAPVPEPRATGLSTGQHNATITLHFYNNAGGAVSGWTLNSDYHTETGISASDGVISSVTFRWDPNASVWREIARAVTT